MNHDEAVAALEGGPGRDGAWPGSIGSSVLPGLAKLGEECSELGEVVDKIWGAGGLAHWDGDLKEKLEDEIADVLAACGFVQQYCQLDVLRIQVRTGKKGLLFKQWHEEAQRG